MRFDEFVRAVEERTGRPGRRNGRHVRLLCPAHDDHTPSLDVSEGEDGRPLAVCRSHGCSFDAIREAVGWEPDRDPGDVWTPKGSAIAVYPYVDENGGHLFDVCRTANKEFPQRRRDPSTKSGWRWNLSGVRRVLYRLPEVLDAVRAGTTVYVCEGEKDADSVCRAGAVGTTNPGGARKWRPEYAEALRGASCVIVADRDEDGIAHARLVADSLRQVNASVRVVQSRGGKDVSDHLAKGHTLDDLVAADALAPAAVLAVTVDVFIANQETIAPPLLGVDDDALIPAGGLVVLAGPAGIGKTTLVLDAVFHLASGLSWLNAPCNRPVRILLIENEGPREQFRRKLERKRQAWPFTRDPLWPVWVQTWRWGSFTISDDETTARLAVFLEENAIDLVVGDPLGTMGVHGVGSPEDTLGFVIALRALGLTQQRAFFFLHHFRKEKATDEIDQISGAWGGHLDSLLVLKAGRKADELRLSFPKLRWAQAERKPLILGKVRTTQGFEVLGEEGDQALLENEIAELLGQVDEPRTLDEIRAGIGGARRDRVRACLETNGHLFTLVEDPTVYGRSAKAKLWLLAPQVGASGRVGEKPLQSGSMSLAPPHPPSVRGGGRDGPSGSLGPIDESLEWR